MILIKTLNLFGLSFFVCKMEVNNSMHYYAPYTNEKTKAQRS